MAGRKDLSVHRTTRKTVYGEPDAKLVPGTNRAFETPSNRIAGLPLTRFVLKVGWAEGVAWVAWFPLAPESGQAATRSPSFRASASALTHRSSPGIERGSIPPLPDGGIAV